MPGVSLFAKMFAVVQPSGFMTSVYVPNFTRLQLGGLVPSVLDDSVVETAMKDANNENIYVPDVPTSGLTGGVVSVVITTPGSGYTDNTYNDVDLTGGSGSGAKATVVIASGATDSVTITAAGTGYKLNEELSFADASVGSGGGSGAKLTIDDLS